VVDQNDWLDVFSTLWWASRLWLYVRSETERSLLWLFKHLAGYSGARPGAFFLRAHGLDASEETDDEYDEYDETPRVLDERDYLNYKRCDLDLW
jgi:hypothetical protein